MLNTKTPTIGIVSLGCPKALVDSERILTKLRSQGYEISPDYAGADAVIVNTCGFLDSARMESLDAIGEAIAENGKVIVTGCMGKEKDLIRETHPKVLSITGPQAYEEVVAAVNEIVPPKHEPFLHLVPEAGLKLTPRHYAYLKISEGCNNRCTFCIIPSIRGDLVSRPMRNVLMEAESLAKSGVKELLIISQDTSAYGVDIKYAESIWRDKQRKAKFYDLADALSELGIWVRMHYVYPYPHVDDVIPLMAEGKILPYLDIPFQHASPQVLKAMRRPANQEKVHGRIEKWRSICPDLAIRSTFIVGFPGETEADFQILLDWLEQAQIDRIGCFQYEPVRGATANDLGLLQVPDEVKAERYERFMFKAQEISARRLAGKIGQTLDVMVDEIIPTSPSDVHEQREARSEGGGSPHNIVGRTKYDAPEIDGKVYLKVKKSLQLKIGDIVQAKITGADEYDLMGRVV